MSLSRRTVLKATLAAIPTYFAERTLGQAVSPSTKASTVPSVEPRVTASLIRAVDVRLLPGSAFHDRQELHRKGVLAMYDPDRLLFHYRALAKLPQHEGVTRGYEGWESGFLRGHMMGHYLSAASRMAAATGDQTFSEKVNYLVAELAKCQAALNLDGYLAAFPTAAFDTLEGKPGNAGGIVVPYYTIHKLMAGLLDAHHYIAHQPALGVVVKMADYFQKRLAGLSAAQIERMFRTDGSRNPQNEFGAMSDVLTEVYRTTRDAKHLATARIFNRPWFVGPLVKGEDHLGGLHANTHIGQAIGLAHCANAGGDLEERKASENFWRLVTQQHSFVNGGNSFREWFDKAGVETGTSIDGGKQLPATTAESCNTHNMLKLTTHLFERNPSMEYAEYYERALHNHALASLAPDTGAVTYFTPLRGDFRTYLNGTFCCTGTGIEATARYNEGIYFKTEDAIYVNLYIPSELSWKEPGMVLRQEGDISRGQEVRLTIVKAGTGPRTLKLRIPSWLAGPAVIKINGQVEQSPASPGTYVSLNHPWKAGDEVVLALPAALRVEKSKDDPSMFSVFFGPVLLAGELGRENMPDRDVADKDAYLRMPPAAVPDIISASTNPADWLEPLPNEKPAFSLRSAGPANGIKFRPLYEVHHQRYSVYWRLSKPNE